MTSETMIKSAGTIMQKYGSTQRRYDTVDLCAIIAKFNCIPMLKWQCSGDCAAIIASNADTE